MTPVEAPDPGLLAKGYIFVARFSEGQFPHSKQPKFQKFSIFVFFAGSQLGSPLRSKVSQKYSRATCCAFPNSLKSLFWK
jgi:hypothetical protein